MALLSPCSPKAEKSAVRLGHEAKIAIEVSVGLERELIVPHLEQ
jgi:hypothetical protein